MSVITVDFETYYDKEYSLSKITTEEYIRSPQFEVIGVGVKVNDARTEWISGSHKQIGERLKKFDWANSFVLAHNTAFDGPILKWCFGIDAKVWLDTLSMARALHGVDVGGSLKALAEQYGIGEKGTEVLNALGKRRLDFAPGELARYGDYCLNDVELTWTLFNRFVAAGFPPKELKLIDTTLRLFIDPVLRLDTELLEAHLKEVQERKETLLASACANKDDLMSNDKFAQILNNLWVDPPTKISPTTGRDTWAFAKTDEGFKALLEHEDERVQALASARLGVKTTIEETRTQRLIDISKRGTLPVPLKYYGARTGRWAADGSINMQNVPRQSTLKKAIVAPEGHVLVGADLSNIELRVGLWLAGEHEKLRQLGDGLDLYKDFAASVFNVKYDEVTKDQRFIGKTSQLSLIYGVGANKLRSAIKTGSGSDIGESTATGIVQLYRTSYAGVANMWNGGNKVLEAILNNRSMQYGHNGFFTVLGSEGVELPSKLLMRYNDLKKMEQDGKQVWDYAVRRGRDRIYGAKVFQGLTQATARCIMAEHILLLRKRYRVVLTVHDAVYMVVPEDQADEAKEQTLAIMRTAPDWIPDIPLDAEAGYGKTLADC
jgi:DNA polymerase I-like protein with 3'-5' exonuclease and polymerase domains